MQVQAEQPQHTAQKSLKQGPSTRKVRRYTNDNFARLSVDIQQSYPSRGRAASEVLALAHSERHLFRPVYDPSEHASQALKGYVLSCAEQCAETRWFCGETL